jgi:transposase
MVAITAGEWAAISAVAGRLGMAPETLRRWLKESKNSGNGKSTGVVDLVAENRDLKKKTAELEQTISIR